MTAGTARNGRPPQDSVKARAFWRAAGLILLFNGLLVAFVLLKPVSDATLALVVNAAQFVGPLLAALPLCFGGLLRWKWQRGASGPDVGPAVTMRQRWAPILLGLGIIVINIKLVPQAFRDIFEGAFTPRAVTGGMEVRKRANAARMSDDFTLWSRATRSDVPAFRAGAGRAPPAGSRARRAPAHIRAPDSWDAAPC